MKKFLGLLVLSVGLTSTLSVSDADAKRGKKKNAAAAPALTSSGAGKLSNTKRNAIRNITSADQALRLFEEEIKTARTALRSHHKHLVALVDEFDRAIQTALAPGDFPLLDAQWRAYVHDHTRGPVIDKLSKWKGLLALDKLSYKLLRAFKAAFPEQYAKAVTKNALIDVAGAKVESPAFSGATAAAGAKAKPKTMEDSLTKEEKERLDLRKKALDKVEDRKLPKKYRGAVEDFKRMFNRSKEEYEALEAKMAEHAVSAPDKQLARHHRKREEAKDAYKAAPKGSSRRAELKKLYEARRDAGFKPNDQMHTQKVDSKEIKRWMKKAGYEIRQADAMDNLTLDAKDPNDLRKMILDLGMIEDKLRTQMHKTKAELERIEGSHSKKRLHDTVEELLKLKDSLRASLLHLVQLSEQELMEVIKEDLDDGDKKKQRKIKTNKSVYMEKDEHYVNELIEKLRHTARILESHRITAIVPRSRGSYDTAGFDGSTGYQSSSPYAGLGRIYSVHG